MWNGQADLLILAVLGIDVRVQDVDLSYCPADVSHNPLGIRGCLAGGVSHNPLGIRGCLAFDKQKNETKLFLIQPCKQQRILEYPQNKKNIKILTLNMKVKAKK